MEVVDVELHEDEVDLAVTAAVEEDLGVASAVAAEEVVSQEVAAEAFHEVVAAVAGAVEVTRLHRTVYPEGSRRPGTEATCPQYCGISLGVYEYQPIPRLSFTGVQGAWLGLL